MNSRFFFNDDSFNLPVNRSGDVKGSKSKKKSPSRGSNNHHLAPTMTSFTRDRHFGTRQTSSQVKRTSNNVQAPRSTHKTPQFAARNTPVNTSGAVNSRRNAGDRYNNTASSSRNVRSAPASSAYNTPAAAGAGHSYRGTGPSFGPSPDSYNYSGYYNNNNSGSYLNNYVGNSNQVNNSYSEMYNNSRNNGSSDTTRRSRQVMPNTTYTRLVNHDQLQQHLRSQQQQDGHRGGPINYAGYPYVVVDRDDGVLSDITYLR
jgi:hypothetical protein